MFPRYDIELDTTYMNANNDIAWTESDVRHVRATIDANKGEYKQFPSDGVAITKYLNSSGMELVIKREVMIELQKDKYPCDNPLVSYNTSGEVIVNPNIQL